MRPTSPEAEVLRLCACQRITSPGAERVDALCRHASFRWVELASAADQRQLGPMVLGNLLTIDGCVQRAPAWLIDAWKQRAAVNTLAKDRQAGIVRDVIAFFARRARVLLLKGVALDAVVYGNLWRVQAGDADLLVDVPADSLSAQEHRELEGLIRDHGVELNYLRHHDVDMNKVLAVDYARLWSDARPIAYRGEPAFVLSPEDMVLTACINLCRKRYQPLKGIVAVQDLTRAFPSLDWDTLLRNARACGAIRILFASLTITAEVLGGDVPDAITREPIGPLRRSLIRRLCRSIASRAIEVPLRSAQSLSERLQSESLRAATYGRGHFVREMRAHRALRRHRATTPIDAQD